MNIVVNQISEDDGLSVHHLYPEGEPHLIGTDLRLTGRAALDLRATRDGEEVRLAGTLKARVAFDCDRCLTPLSIPVEQSFDLLYVHPTRSSANDEKELGGDDLSVAFYQGQAIDLDDVVREQIEFALPMHRLCREDCKGLCQLCGANLNEGLCGCESKELDPRWAALKELKSDS
jgi:uncharacterized protein